MEVPDDHTSQDGTQSKNEYFKANKQLFTANITLTMGHKSRKNRCNLVPLYNFVTNLINTNSQQPTRNENSSGGKSC